MKNKKMFSPGMLVQCVENPINKDNIAQAPIKGEWYVIVYRYKHEAAVISEVPNEDNHYRLWDNHLFECPDPIYSEFGSVLLGGN